MPIFFCKEHGAFGAGSKLCECLKKQLKKEQEEIDRAFAGSRVLSRTLIRVVDIDPKGVYFYVVIPGWNVRKNVRIDYDNFPGEMRPLVTIGKRFHARVNVGAETRKDLYFDSWEPE